MGGRHKKAPTDFSKTVSLDTELATVDWDMGLQVLNVTSGEQRQLIGPTIFVRL